MQSARLAGLAFLLLILCFSSVLAQRPGPEFRRPLACEPLEPRTRLEAIESRYERVITKGFSQFATISTRGTEIRLDAIEMKDTGDSTRAIGLVIALRELADNPRENRAFIDYQEIDRLIKGMESVARVNETITKLAGFEARYRTLGDLEINVFRQTRTGTAASISSGICDRVTALLTLDDLGKLRGHIIEAKARLDEIK
ncbi:MAG TPA: hypothetical protein VNO50_15955 [Pyrinomonadaceae bacterium]|nr:hypothetical protein [Pyrinomonadaceae bacterium]